MEARGTGNSRLESWFLWLSPVTSSLKVDGVVGPHDMDRTAGPPQVAVVRTYREVCVFRLQVVCDVLDALHCPCQGR